MGVKHEKATQKRMGSCATSGCLHDILATRLAAAEAERDAAVARAEALADSYSKPFAAQVAEGERRATAAIVADLRAMPSYRVNRSAIAEIEQYHLKGNPQ